MLMNLSDVKSTMCYNQTTEIASDKWISPWSSSASKHSWSHPPRRCHWSVMACYWGKVRCFFPSYYCLGSVSLDFQSWPINSSPGDCIYLFVCILSTYLLPALKRKQDILNQNWRGSGWLAASFHHGMLQGHSAKIDRGNWVPETYWSWVPMLKGVHLHGLSAFNVWRNLCLLSEITLRKLVELPIQNSLVRLSLIFPRLLDLW